MAIAYAGERASVIIDAASQTQVAMTFSAATTAGNLLLVLYGGSSQSVITGVPTTDPRGNTWYLPAGLQGVNSGNNGATIMYTFQDVAAYANGDQIIFPVSNGAGHTLTKAEEFSGVADVATTHDDGRASGTTSTVSITPGNTGDLIVYLTCGTATGGWVVGTIGGVTPDGSGTIVSGTATQRTLGWEYLLSGGSGSLSCTSTAGATPGTAVGAFKSSGPAPTALLAPSSGFAHSSLHPPLN